MSPFVIMLLLGGPARPPVNQGLDAYMAGLEQAVARWRRIFQLTVEERTDEAGTLVASPLPTAMKNDFSRESDHRVPRRDARHPGSSVYAVAHFGMELGLPELAVPVFDEAEGRGENVPDGVASSVWRDLQAVGETTLGAEWAARRRIGSHEQLPTSETEALAARASRASPRARARLALVLWGMAPSLRITERQKLEMLESMLPPEGRRLARESILDVDGLSAADRAAVLSRLARDSPASGQYTAWERLSLAAVPSESKARALVEMAAVRVGEGRPQDAVRLLTRARGDDPSVAPDAQWHLAVDLFALGDYAEALEGFRRSEVDLPRHTCCGESHALEYAIWEGLTLEHLGRAPEAVPHYLSAFSDMRVMAHLIDLYEMAGQLADLEGVVGELTPKDPAAYWKVAPSLELLVMSRIARARDWASLVAVLREMSTRSLNPNGTDSMKANEAVRLLARACDETVPLLTDALGTEDSYARGWVAYALGKCGTPAVRARLNSAGFPDVPPAPRIPVYRPRGEAELGTLLFPPAKATRLPAQPGIADHTPRPYNGPGGPVCICM